jgi:hypothetical protein
VSRSISNESVGFCAATKDAGSLFGYPGLAQQARVLKIFPCPPPVAPDCELETGKIFLRNTEGVG